MPRRRSARVLALRRAVLLGDLRHLKKLVRALDKGSTPDPGPRLPRQHPGGMLRRWVPLAPPPAPPWRPRHSGSSSTPTSTPCTLQEQPTVDFDKVEAYMHQLKGSSTSADAQKVKFTCIQFRQDKNRDGFLASIFDPSTSGHLQKLKDMNPIDVETTTSSIAPEEARSAAILCTTPEEARLTAILGITKCRCLHVFTLDL